MAITFFWFIPWKKYWECFLKNRSVSSRGMNKTRGDNSVKNETA